MQKPQAKARLDEKLLTEKREIDAIVARLGELRQVCACLYMAAQMYGQQQQQR
jgi:hypothetical protein